MVFARDNWPEPRLESWGVFSFQHARGASGTCAEKPVGARTRVQSPPQRTPTGLRLPRSDSISGFSWSERGPAELDLAGTFPDAHRTDAGVHSSHQRDHSIYRHIIMSNVHKERVKLVPDK